jgi:hypothetical protein
VWVGFSLFFAKLFAKNGAVPAARNATKNGAFLSPLPFPSLI